ncbi:DNA N-6-adenine-methyltransferase [Corynebacterium flavescens]|uniref:N-6-adenine-methyltransferase n=1 Tax=Corynebacterium flavescens TaxID=28028 RepID=A0AB73B782_CORFL|nr:DNA N-6-adenine-methyltransferase [Corynebacterium flavescens]KAA8720482.1 adenine methyltransferase [Corynebacterium flavescens]GEB97757.1 N-6-adenine-methyltransferase [Corynebacterium flavescens]
MTSGFVHESSVSDSVEWFTPAWVFERLGARFDLDPCSPGKGLTHVPASHHLTVKEDGLTSPWVGRVWCNPPYGPGIEKWLGKCSQLSADAVGSAIALVPNRTDTRWFQKAMADADATLFLAGRIKFHRGDKDAPPTGSPGTGSALIAYGDWAADTLRKCSLPGFYIGSASMKGRADAKQ